MNAEKIMIDCLGYIKYTTTGMYYKQFNDLISSLKQKGDKVKKFMIFCQPIVENEVRQIAKYFKVEYKATSLMDEHTLILIVKKDFFNTNNRLKQARDVVLKELNGKNGTINALKIALKERTDERDKKDEIIDKKDKIIDAMLEEITDCEFEMQCSECTYECEKDYDQLYECNKQYFERKVENGGR